jgi:O-antigen/teichoic acid export membrane protein
MRNSNSLQAFWLGLGNLSSFLIAIISTAIFSRYFTKAEYGTYRQIVYVYSTLLVIFSAGLPTVYSYFLPRYSLSQGKDVVSKVSWLLFFAGMIFSLFLLCSSGMISQVLKNPELDLALKIFSPVPMLLLPTLGIEGIFASYKRTYYIAIYNVVTKVISLLLITLPVIFLHKSYIFALYGWNLASLISFAIAHFIKRIPFKYVISEKSNIAFIEIFKYSLPLVAASLWGMAIKAADQFYISRYFGSEVFAEFSNGFIEIPIVGMITGAISTMLIPIYSKMVFEKSDISELVSIYRSVLQKSAMIIYPLVVFFLFNSGSIIIILYSSKYLNSIIYFQIAVILNLFNVIIFAPIILALGKTKFYSNLHMYMAFVVWGLEFIAVSFFNSPIIIAVLSVTLSILKVIIAFLYVARFINVKFSDLIPFKSIVYYFLHSTGVILLTQLFFILLFPNLNIIPRVFASFSLYFILVITTGIPLKLEYLSILEPILGNFRISKTRI